MERSVKVDNLVLVRRPKLCTAILKVGAKVRLNSGSPALRVTAIDGDAVTVESRDWRGRPEDFTMPRGCWQKASAWNWLKWKLGFN